METYGQEKYILYNSEEFQLLRDFSSYHDGKYYNRDNPKYFFFKNKSNKKGDQNSSKK